MKRAVPPSEGSTRRLRRYAAETALARFESAQRLAKVVFAERRPHRGCEIQFGVGTLPQHEITQALLPTRPNQQVDVAHRPGIVMDFSKQFAEVLSRERVGGGTARHLLCITLGGEQDPV